MAVIGAQRSEDVPVSSSEDGEIEPTTAPPAEDTRAPVGRDAGDPEATYADAHRGWEGGAEDDAQNVLGQVKEAVSTAEHRKMPMPEMQYDEETEEMVEQALQLDREAVIREMEGLN